MVSLIWKSSIAQYWYWLWFQGNTIIGFGIAFEIIWPSANIRIRIQTNVYRTTLPPSCFATKLTLAGHYPLHRHSKIWWNATKSHDVTVIASCFYPRLSNWALIGPQGNGDFTTCYQLFFTKKPASCRDVLIEYCGAANCNTVDPNLNFAPSKSNLSL